MRIFWFFMFAGNIIQVCAHTRRNAMMCLAECYPGDQYYLLTEEQRYRSN